MPRSIPRYCFSPSKARRLIDRAGLTITLAAAHLELSTNSVGRWFAPEGGRQAQPTVGNLKRLSLLLGCSPDDLIEVERD